MDNSCELSEASLTLVFSEMSCGRAAAEPEVQAPEHVEQHIEPPRIDEVDFAVLFCSRHSQSVCLSIHCVLFTDYYELRAYSITVFCSVIRFSTADTAAWHGCIIGVYG